MRFAPIQYNESDTLAIGLRQYLTSYGLGDGGYTAKWFALPVARGVSIKLPNVRRRVIVVQYHDLHHVVTGYRIGYKGEAEIGAWEIASGCGEHLIAWVFNLGAMIYGLVGWPKPVFRAFVRGRHSRNFYHKTPYEPLLSQTIGETRNALQLAIDAAPTRADIFYFCLWIVISVANVALAASCVALPIVLLLK